MNFRKHVVQLLSKYSASDIVITHHASIQAVRRNIDLNEVKKNIVNPTRLEFAGKQTDTKFDCYFIYSNTQCHRYILVLQRNCIVCTVIKINRRWQRMVEKYAKV